MVILASLVQQGALLVGFSATVFWVTTMRLKYPRSADRPLGDTGFVPTERRMRVSSSLNSEMAVRQALLFPPRPTPASWPGQNNPRISAFLVFLRYDFCAAQGLCTP